MTLSIPSARAVIAAASPGPWEADVWIETDGSGWRATGPHHESDDDDASDGPGCPDEQAAQRDAQFIAAARTGWPEALDRIEALEAALAEACDLVPRMCNGEVGDITALNIVARLRTAGSKEQTK